MNFSLHFGLDVNHQVAATDQVHSQERRVAKHVMLGKGDAFADALVDLIAAILFDEEARQALLGDVAGDALRVDPIARGAKVLGCRYPRRRSAGLNFSSPGPSPP